jgi:hypothetical protein
MGKFICLRGSAVLMLFALNVSCAAGFGQASAPAQTNTAGQPAAKGAPPALPEMWAKLPAHVDLEKLKVGDTVDAVVAQRWDYHTCGVDPGTHLTGKVVAVTPWSDPGRTTQAAIAFSGVCTNQDKVALILIAIHYITDDDMSQRDMANAQPQGVGPGAYGRTAPSPIQIESLPSPGAGTPIYPLAKFGEVKGLHHITLDVAKGPEGATLISTPDKKSRLDAGSRLALVPVPVPQKN